MNIQQLAVVIPFWAVHPLLRSRVSGFFLHDVCDSPPLHIRHLYRPPTVSEFRDILGFLARQFTFVGLAEVVAHYREGKPLPRCAAFFSVDDGSQSCRQVIGPMLKEMGIPATFFLTTRALNNGILFAAHKRSLIIDRLIAEKAPAAEIAVPVPSSGDFVQVPLAEALSRLKRFAAHTPAGKAALDQLGKSLGIDWQSYLDVKRPFLNDDDVRWLLDQGFGIGAHGTDHTKFQFLDEAARAAQVREAVSTLCERFGVTQVPFSFPNSSAGVSRDWMRHQLNGDSRISIFIDTGKYARNSAVIVNRINLDRSATRQNLKAPGAASTAAAIKSALVRELTRRR